MDRQANKNDHFYNQPTVSGIIYDMVTLARVAGLTAGEERLLWVTQRIKMLSEMWFTHIFLIVCLLLYSALGAVTFMVLEGPHEKMEINETGRKFLEYSNMRDDFMTLVQVTCDNSSTVSVWGLENTTDITILTIHFIPRSDHKIMHLFVCGERNNSSFFAKQFEKHFIIYEKNVTAYREFVAMDKYVPPYKKTWRFWNSMLYAATIYSTIGYGHITPKTMSGRVVTIIYSLIGIPFFLIVLADFGKLLTKGMKYTHDKIMRRVERKMLSHILNTSIIEMKLDANDDHHSEGKPSDDPLEQTPDAHVDLESEEHRTKTDPRHIPDEDNNDTFDFTVSYALSLLLIYIFFGAAIFTVMEPWSYCDSFYFTFISMSTIGLGDIVPSKPKYMIVLMFYLICGLALMSMCITVVQNKLFVTFNKAQKKIAESMGIRAHSVRK